MKTAELTLDQLDYWVAKAQSIDVWYPRDGDDLVYIAAPSLPPRKWKPTRYWSQGGPLIEQAHIDLNWDVEGNHQWSASVEPDILAQGKTALEAAMRAFVTARFGTELNAA